MDVKAALAACVTTADRYRVQIEAENLLAPLEVDALHDADLDPPARVWIDRLWSLCNGVARPRQAFRRLDLAANATYYEGPGAERGRVLVVAFTGVGLRLMMPVAPFLQGLPAERCDMVVLRDADRNSFLCGVPGYAQDFPALAARIAADIPSGRHAEWRTLGTSAGGAAALAMGAVAGARLALSLGGGHPIGFATRQGDRRLDYEALGSAVAAAQPGTRLVCAHGRACTKDIVRSRLLAMAVRGSVLEVEGVSEHAVLTPLMREGTLARFFSEVLLGDSLPEDGVWRP
jgi:hypothetical protein